MEHEPRIGREEEFEQELRQAFERRPAPPRLKRRIMDGIRKQQEARRRARLIWWPRIAATFALLAIAAGLAIWHRAEVRRRGEEARQQVLTAFRITTHALNEMNSRLSTRDHARE
ncbi:MAG TPA: hypothetical protein VLZ50_12500 [Terracidiphilus sp.]|nr:hypothetical protein [Terracidiphilus sp.]